MPSERFSYTSFFILWNEEEPYEGETYGYVRGEEFTTHYDLVDPDARIMMAYSLRRIADRLLCAISHDVMSERYPRVVGGQQWEDRPLF